MDAGARPRQLPPPSPAIRTATDLGGVAVLKHGNLYLLTDERGDVRPDSRGLGLYDLDSRVLSCAVLRINGDAPALLRSEAGDVYLATYELSVSVAPGVGVTRRRWIAGGLAEQIEVTNRSDSRQAVRLDLTLDADAADVFEVRGWVRERRGRHGCRRGSAA